MTQALLGAPGAVVDTRRVIWGHPGERGIPSVSAQNRKEEGSDGFGDVLSLFGSSRRSCSDRQVPPGRVHR